MELTQARLKEILSYDPETGVFTWLKTICNRAKKGDIAGTYGNGYRYIKIDYKQCKASRLAWLYMKGYMPEHEVDHKDRVPSNDKWENLRHVSHQCNMRNRSISKNNTSGVIGISWIRERKKWFANIMISGKTIGLGRFKLKINAARARWQAEAKYGFPDCNTTSSAYLYLQEYGGV